MSMGGGVSPRIYTKKATRSVLNCTWELHNKRDAHRTGFNTRFTHRQLGQTASLSAPVVHIPLTQPFGAPSYHGATHSDAAPIVATTARLGILQLPPVSSPAGGCRDLAICSLWQLLLLSMWRPFTPPPEFLSSIGPLSAPIYPPHPPPSLSPVPGPLTALPLAHIDQQKLVK